MSHLGLADERCPVCGNEIETLLDTTGRNPLRTCWKCEVEEQERSGEVIPMYDSKCADLADAFLDDEPELKTKENLEMLAQLIQDTIEDFITDARERVTKRD